MKFFHSVNNVKAVGDGTVGDLVDWLERLINVLFPDNGIEYWADDRCSGTHALKRAARLPMVGYEAEHIHHIVSYVREGGCEGHIIEVGLYMRTGEVKTLSWAKTFGGEEESWTVARVISKAMDSILLYGEVPEIVEMADKMPRQQRWHRETSLKEMITIGVQQDAIEVISGSGLVLDRRDWKSAGPNAKFSVEARLKDWEIVLSNMKANFRVEVANCDLAREAA